MTIKEFITECELFEYSQEYFDILKECSEIELLERYIENSYYQLYNESTLDDEFFTEAENETKIKYLKTKAVKKKVGLFRILLRKLGKLKKAFLGFLKKISGKFADKGFRNNASRLAANINNGLYDDESLIKFIEQKIDDHKIGIELTDENKSKIKEFARDLVGGNKTIHVYINRSEKIATSLDAIVSAMDGFSKMVNPKSDHTDAWGGANKLESKLKDIDSSRSMYNAPIDIYVDPNKINAAISKLESVNTDIDLTQAVQQVNVIEDIDQEDIVKTVTMLNSYVAGTIKFYTEFLRFREDIVNTIDSTLDVDPSKKDMRNKGKYKSKGDHDDYVEKDRDMIELIHLLGEVYRRTDEYLHRG